MSAPDDPLLSTAARLTAELRARCAAPDVGDGVEGLLIDGYASALALEGARRLLREQTLELTSRELAIAVQERELRMLLRTLRARRAPRPASSEAVASDDEPAPQRLYRRL
ncbi:MAG TPA: hypothetical protein VFG31_04725 [Conexibacter sp.]|nr:hypothetical protein [Conexibacter sp.]